jgi:hypothetical protein
MNRKKITSVTTAAALGVAILAVTNIAHAFNMGNMMNPGDWFDDDDDDYYRYGRGYYGGYGPYGYGPYGGGPYGWGGGPYGWGGGYPGYGGQPSTIVVNPSSGKEQAPPPPRLPE